MKRSSRVWLLVSVFALAVDSHAQVPPAPQNIVTVSFNTAVLQTAEAQKELGALQQKLAPRQAQLKALNDEVEASRKQVQNPGDKANDIERSTQERSLETKEKQLQRQAEDFRNDSETESQQVFQRVAQKFYVFLQQYAQQHSYSAVIERGSDAAPVVWYAAGNLDITDQVVKAFNAQSSAASSGTPDRPIGGGLPTPAKTLPDSPSPHP
jgi:outer membrane protein